MIYQNTVPVVNSINDDGRTMRLFPFPADFNKDVSESYEWKTDIIVSFDDTEQRQAVRARPRRTFEFYILAAREDQALFNNLMHAHQQGVWGVPAWHKRATLAADHTVNATSYTPTDLTDFSGDYLVFYISPACYELVTITGRTGGAITFSALTNLWPMGTLVMPVYAGKLLETVTMSPKTGVFTSGEVAFTLLSQPSPYAGGSYTDFVGTFPGLTHQVLEYGHDWTGGSDNTYLYKTEVADAGINDHLVELEGLRRRTTQAFQFFLNSKDVIKQFLAMADTYKGKFKEFLLPSQKADFSVLAYRRNGLASDVDAPTKLSVAFTGFSELVAASLDTLSSRDKLRIAFKSGEIAYRRIASSTVGTGCEVLTMSSALPSGYTAEDIYMVSFLLVARFDSDRVELVYKHSNFAIAATSIKTLTRVI